MNRGLLLAGSAYLCWGLLSPGNEILLRELPPLWLQALRGGIAALIVAVVFRDRLGRVPEVLSRPAVTATLITGTFASFAFFTMAQTRIPATFTTLGFYTAPLWTALFGWVFLRERVGPAFWLAALAMLGGGYLALTGGGVLPDPDVLGMLLAVGAGLTWALYTVGIRKYAPETDWRDLLLASLLLGGALFLLSAWLLEPPPAWGGLSATTWRWTGIQVAIPTLAALGLFQVALRHTTAARVNVLVGLELAGTVFFAWLLLDASFSAVQLVGLAVTLIAVSGYLWHRARIEA